MSVVFDGARHCGSKTRAGSKCTLVRGWGTKHVGAGKCRRHGGNTPNGRKHAETEQVENALRTLKIEDAVDPVQSLFEAVRVAAWREHGLRIILVGRATLAGPDRNGEGKPDVVAVMHAHALEQRAKIAAMAITAGLDERIVHLAERQGEVIHRIITAALDAAGVAGDARERAEEAAVRELVAVGPSGDERN